MNSVRNKGCSFGNDHGNAFKVLLVGGCVIENAIPVIAVSEFFNGGFEIVGFEVGFSQDKDVIFGAKVVSNGLKFVIVQSLDILG